MTSDEERMVICEEEGDDDVIGEDLPPKLLWGFFTYRLFTLNRKSDGFLLWDKESLPEIKQKPGTSWEWFSIVLRNIP